MFLSEEDDILRRCAEHYDELLNIELSNQNATSQEIYQVYCSAIRQESITIKLHLDNTMIQRNYALRVACHQLVSRATYRDLT
jgi:hypothetical protein